jgi:LAS superfamily LD-carboxypeptidase LdcB
LPVAVARARAGRRSVSLSPSQRRWLGFDDVGLVACADHHRLLPAAAEAFTALRRRAAEAGFDLCIASAYRSFERQRRIWNGKLSGERPVFDDGDRPVAMGSLDLAARMAHVLRFSALPGASRHHWGSDLDVYDAAAMPAGYRLRLDQAEVADDGLFGPLHRWLDARIAAGESCGFYRPYDRDRGGVAPERWHLSFAPLAQHLEREVNARTLLTAWQECESLGAEGPVAGLHALYAAADALTERYVLRVAPAPRQALAWGGVSGES